jgi:hypothetical protein
LAGTSATLPGAAVDQPGDRLRILRGGLRAEPLG